ncbi:STM4015 family protein [Yinghuangia sp. ASG 101]|uniref:STM4015 family protein n=1 Tax=Yinghuangia sp. ASG 101 TaxID=2896848 RepID=UPI001E65778A|nr:STM4015 family protein [Yinghuangia sp. ASG 101]UGQ13294.1 STM4015 family protein [Yinghuangia sp. ASG 101]
MTFSRELLTTFAGLPVVALHPIGTLEYDWYADPAALGPDDDPPPADSVAWRLRVLNEEYTEDAEDLPTHFARFLKTVDTTRVRALTIGSWGPSYEPPDELTTEMLCASADRFPALRHLYIGDISREEDEISWIVPGDVTTVLEAFPALETLAVRGAPEMRPTRHEALTRLEFHSGGLPGDVLVAVGVSEFPALRRLSAMLGTANYGGIGDAEPLAGVLTGDGMPLLTHLGLRDSAVQDAVAVAVSGAPIVARLTELDLSMGALGDEGAEALLSGQPLTHLTRLDLHHHFLGEPMRERLRSTLVAAGVDVDLSEPCEAEEWGRYIAVSE